MRTRGGWMLMRLAGGVLGVGSAQQQKKVSSAEWDARMPAIVELLKGPNFHRAGADPDNPDLKRVGVLKKSHLPVALVDVGSGYGAMNNGIAVFVVSGRQVIAPAFRFDSRITERGGTVFSEGSSVMHSEWVEIDSADDAIVTRTATMNQDGTGIASCKVEAFRWDAGHVMFVRDVALGQRLHRVGCKFSKDEM